MLFLPAKVLEGLIGVWTLSYTTACLTHEAYDRFSTVNTVVVFANLLLLGWIINSTTRYVGEYADTPAAGRFWSTAAMLWAAPNHQEGGEPRRCIRSSWASWCRPAGRSAAWRSRWRPRLPSLPSCGRCAGS